MKGINIASIILNIFYTILHFVFWFFVISTQNSYYTSTEDSVVVGFLALVGGTIAIALLVLGIVGSILYFKADKEMKGRTLGLIYTIMQAAGMILGWIPLFAGIYSIAVAALALTSTIQLVQNEKKDTDIATEQQEEFDLDFND